MLVQDGRRARLLLLACDGFDDPPPRLRAGEQGRRFARLVDPIEKALGAKAGRCSVAAILQKEELHFLELFYFLECILNLYLVMIFPYQIAYYILLICINRNLWNRTFRINF